MNVDGRILVELLDNAGVPDWRDVFSITVDPPAVLTVKWYLRNEDGQFYLDEARDTAASDSVVRRIEWPNTHGGDC